jgi:hypothetical protein
MLGGLLWIAAAGLVARLVWSEMATPSGPASFYQINESGTVSITWVDDGSGHLTGSVTIVSKGEPSSGSFTGTLHDGQVSLVIPRPLEPSTTWVGTLRGDRMTLMVPQTDGTDAPVVFTRGALPPDD